MAELRGRTPAAAHRPGRRPASSHERIVLLQNTLAPYRVSLFNCLSEALGGGLTVLLAHADPPPSRSWRIPWEDVRFDTRILGASPVASRVSTGVSAALDAIDPTAIIVGGWDVPASWAAVWWARRRGVPVHAWVESSRATGRWRGGATNKLRSIFLSGCASAIVPGMRAEQFVVSLRPSLPCHVMANSIDSPELRALAPPERNGAVLYVGSLSTRKGADIILAAAADLLTVFPRLVVAGDGPLQNQFAERARHLDGLEVLGFVDATQRARCMERASVVLLPSRRDPWPLAACEALVARRPLVLGTGVGSRPDLETLVGDGVVPMRSPDVDGLLAASRAARTCHVPDGMRAAFTPQSSAEAMVAAVAEAAHQRPASNPHG